MYISTAYGQMWHVAWPILISLVMEHLISLTDTAFLGRVGEVELGASAMAGVFYLAILLLGYGFSIGAQILVGRRNGEKRHEDIGPLVIQGILFLLLVAIGAFVLTRTLAPIIFPLLISSPEISAASLSYMDWRAYGLFFAFPAFMFRAFYVGITDTRILTVNSLVMVSTNVVLNYMLIFGHWGFPRMGIAGAALASSLSEMVSLIFYMVHVRLRVDRTKYGLHRAAFKDMKQVRPMLSLSVWTMAQYFVGISVWFLFFAAIEHLGGREIAISNMVRSFGGMLCLVPFAFGSAVSTMVSNHLGAGRPDEVMPTCLRGIVLCSVLILPFMAFSGLFPELVLRLYTDNLELVQQGVPSLLVLTSAFFLAVPAAILFNAVSGTGNTRHAMWLDFVAFTIYTLYVYIIIVRLRMDVAICWTSEHMYWLPLLILSGLYMRSGKWRRKKI